jgi:hypothetical protein
LFNLYIEKEGGGVTLVHEQKKALMFKIVEDVIKEEKLYKSPRKKFFGEDRGY